jgi:diguanylate cyclase (GGDEF)-like protein/PAS domain S-box-containing protein
MPSNSPQSKIPDTINENARAWLAAVVAFGAGAVLTTVLVMSSNQRHERQVQLRFNMLADERLSRVQERLDDQVQRLDGLRRFFVYSDEVLRSEFDGYAAPLLVLTQAYSWAPKVAGAERGRFEQHARDEGLSGYTVREIDTATGGLKTAAERSEYFPVLFTQSRSTQPLPLGFDLSSESIRDATLKRATQTGSMAVSTRMTLVGIEPDIASGVLLVAPVLHPASNSDSQNQALSGYVMAVISFSRLMSDGLPGEISDNLALQLFDASSPGVPDLLYQSSNTAAHSHLRLIARVSLADREYSLVIRPAAAFLVANQSVASVVVMGGLFSLILSALLYSLVSRRQRALKLVELRTIELRSVLDATTQVAIIATDLTGTISTFNAGAQQMLGYNGDEVLGQLALRDLHLLAELQTHGRYLSRRYGREVAVAEVMLFEALEEGGHPTREWTFVRKDGSSLMVNMLVTAVRNDQDQWTGFLVICIDVTEGKRVHEALAARDLMLEKLSAQVPGGIYQYQVNSDGSSWFNYTNSGMWRIYELSQESMQGETQAVLNRIHSEDRDRIIKSIDFSAQNLTHWCEEYRVELPRQGLRWLRGEATPERLIDGGVLWHGFVSDISDLKRVEEELRGLSVTDVLTGVYNRRFFQERLKAELSRAQRHGGALSVIMLDIDHFKRINDQFGHAAGDQALQGLCQRINQRLRRDDVFCRLGGEEFMVLCPDTNGENAYTLAVELWDALRREPIDGVGAVSASFGIASWRTGESEDALLLRADSGVYGAKQSGRDRVMPELP